MHPAMRAQIRVWTTLMATSVGFWRAGTFTIIRISLSFIIPLVKQSLPDLPNCLRRQQRERLK